MDLHRSLANVAENPEEPNTDEIKLRRLTSESTPIEQGQVFEISIGQQEGSEKSELSDVSLEKPPFE